MPIVRYDRLCFALIMFFGKSSLQFRTSNGLSFIKLSSRIYLRNNEIVAARKFFIPSTSQRFAIGNSLPPIRQFSSLLATESSAESDTCLNPVTNIENDANVFVGDYADDEYPFCPILKDLNPNQIKAVTQPLSAITRVVAGPGSGKTRVLTSRIAYLLQEDRRSRILAVTFTRKAAGEMQQRVEKLLLLTQQQQTSEQGDNIMQEVADNGSSVDSPLSPAGLERISLGTFHSICAKILRWNGDCLASLPSVIADMSKSGNQTVLDNSFNIVDQGEQIRVMKDSLQQHGIDLAKHDLKPIDIVNFISNMRVEMMKGKDPFDDPTPEKLIPPRVLISRTVYYTYRQSLLSSNCIDFDDLIYLARELLLVNTDVRQRLQQRWAHVLVDEFQDTSQSQLDLIKLLTSSSLFVVGDADQSIYSWRGAHVGSMNDFEHDFKEFHDDGVSTVYLMENYRSTSNIVKAAQKVISDSSDSSNKSEFRREMVPKRAKGPAPRIVACDNSKAEAEFIVKHVADRIGSGEYGPKNSVACIYRTNAQSRALEEACARYNVPFVLFGSATSFYKRQEIKDCLCYLRWLYNGRDRPSMLRAMTTPKRGIGDGAIREFDEYCVMVDNLWEEKSPDRIKPTSLEVLLHLSGDDSWCKWSDAEFPQASMSGRSLKLMVAFSNQMRRIREVGNVATVETLLSYIIDEMELISHLDKISKTKSEFEERKQNVQELQSASQRYNDEGACMQTSTPKTEEGEFTLSPLGKFLDDVTLVSDMVDNEEQSSEERFVVSLMTIHASKGTEFDHVYFVGLEDGTIPTSQAVKEGKNSIVLEEEKRLCYVAMTRAKTELIMTWRREVPVFTKEGIRSFPRNRSRFLDVLTQPQGKNSKKEGQPTDNGNHDVAKPMGSSGSTSMVARAMSQPTRSFSTSRSSYDQAISSRKQTAEKFIGTAGVYGKTLSSFERAAPSTMSSNSPDAKRRINYSVDKSKSVQPQSVARKKVVVSANVKYATSTASVPTAAIAKKQAPASKPDSTWFFPVGTSVSHNKLGKGVVLPPKSNLSGEAMLVHVQFLNGEKREFPVDGPDLSPIVER